jgi:hypothetical protein
MKRCPNCNRTFEDTQSFCGTDGTHLIDETPTSFDPFATMMVTPSAAKEKVVQPVQPVQPEENVADVTMMDYRRTVIESPSTALPGPERRTEEWPSAQRQAAPQAPPPAPSSPPATAPKPWNPPPVAPAPTSPPQAASAAPTRAPAPPPAPALSPAPAVPVAPARAPQAKKGNAPATMALLIGIVNVIAVPIMFFLGIFNWLGSLLKSVMDGAPPGGFLVGMGLLEAFPTIGVLFGLVALLLTLGKSGRKGRAKGAIGLILSLLGGFLIAAFIAYKAISLRL